MALPPSISCGLSFHRVHFYGAPKIVPLGSNNKIGSSLENGYGDLLPVRIFGFGYFSKIVFPVGPAAHLDA